VPKVKEGLSPKEWRFVRHYCKTSNATESAIKAGYSPKSAGKIGWELLQKTRISDAIAERRALYAAKIDFSIEEYHAILAGQARGDMTDFGEWDGESATLYPSREVDGRLVRELKIKKTVNTHRSKDGAENVTEQTEAMLELYDAQQAAKLLGEALGYHPTSAPNKGPDGSSGSQNGEVVKVYSAEDWNKVPRPPEADEGNDDDQAAGASMPPIAEAEEDQDADGAEPDDD
jgi:phage terminase small subunit